MKCFAHAARTALILMLTAALVCAVPFAGLAESAETEVREKSLVRQFMDNLKTVNWAELPQEMKERIQETDWEGLQEQIRSCDWKNVLEKIRSFLSDTEWDQVRDELAHQITLMMLEAAEDYSALAEYLKSVNWEEVAGQVEDSAADLSRNLEQVQAGLQEKWSEFLEGAAQKADEIGERLDTLEENASSEWQALGERLQTFFEGLRQ